MFIAINYAVVIVHMTNKVIIFLSFNIPLSVYQSKHKPIIQFLLTNGQSKSATQFQCCVTSLFWRTQVEQFNNVGSMPQVSIQQTDFPSNSSKWKHPKLQDGNKAWTKSLLLYSRLAGFTCPAFDFVVLLFTFTHYVVLWCTCAQEQWYLDLMSKRKREYQYDSKSHLNTYMSFSQSRSVYMMNICDTRISLSRCWACSNRPYSDKLCFCIFYMGIPPLHDLVLWETSYKDRKKWIKQTIYNTDCSCDSRWGTR